MEPRVHTAMVAKPGAIRAARCSQQSDEAKNHLESPFQVMPPGAAGLPARLEAVVPVLDPGQSNRRGDRLAGHLVGRAEGITRALADERRRAQASRAWDGAPGPAPDGDRFAQPEPKPDFEFDQRVAW